MSWGNDQVGQSTVSLVTEQAGAQRVQGLLQMDRLMHFVISETYLYSDVFVCSQLYTNDTQICTIYLIQNKDEKGCFNKIK